MEYYLCTNNYNCQKFDSFVEANKYYTNNKNNNYSHIIGISKYIPSFLHNFMIKYKLFNSKKLSDINYDSS